MTQVEHFKIGLIRSRHLIANAMIVSSALSTLVGCQTSPLAKSVANGPMRTPPTMPANHHAMAAVPAQANNASPLPYPAATHASAPNSTEASYVAQASFQEVHGGVHGQAAPGIGMPIVPMATYPGQAPMPMAGQNRCSCSGCNSSYGVYQPVYANGDLNAPSCSAELPCAPTVAPGGIDPQEYIYDGGDQSPAVRIRDDYSLVGLGPEDTVVQFTTEDGREFAETGCRTAIYAPRFASIRRISTFQKSEGVLAARAALKDEPLVHMHAPLPPTQVKEKLVAGRESSVKVVEAFRERNRGVPVLQNLAPLGWSNAFRPYEDLQLIRTGVVEDTERVALLKSAANAVAWSSVDELLVIVDNQAAAIVESEDHPQELLTYELGGARIRLCKVASQQSANVGEVVDFTIRFDNIADQVLSELVIHDSLPPRLEYVADSQQSSLKTSFTTEANEVGSEVLKWKIETPLKPGEGGIVRFQARVR